MLGETAKENHKWRQQKQLLKLKDYRMIQLICEMFNDCAKNQVAPGVLVCNPAIQIFSSFVCIKLHSKIPMPGFLYFPIQLLDCTVLGLGKLTIASHPWTKSKGIIHSWKTEHTSSTSKFVRKTVNSTETEGEVRKQLCG
jgi:hypothetical protein